jgi:hypothetical protein
MASAPHITAALVICAPLDDDEENPFPLDELLGEDGSLAEAAVEANVASVAVGLILLTLEWHCSSE